MPTPAPTRPLVFDSSVLSCFARAGRLDDLQALTETHRRVVTRAVQDEIEQGIQQHLRLAEVQQCTWLEVVHGDSLEELAVFSDYVRLLGCGTRDVGEAATLAWAEVHRAVAILDDQTAANVSRQRGVRLKRTLSLVSTGVQQNRLSEEDAAALVDDLIGGGARFPCDGRHFIAWCREKGLLV